MLKLIYFDSFKFSNVSAYHMNILDISKVQKWFVQSNVMGNQIKGKADATKGVKTS